MANKNFQDETRAYALDAGNLPYIQLPEIFCLSACDRKKFLEIKISKKFMNYLKQLILISIMSWSLLSVINNG